MMKYVFYSVFWSSSAPKAADEIISMLKHSSGTEMLIGYLPSYLRQLNDAVDSANRHGRHAEILMHHTRELHYTDHKVHGQISFYQNGKYGQKDIARIDYITVDGMWATDFAIPGYPLRVWTFEEFEKSGQSDTDQEKEGGER